MLKHAMHPRLHSSLQFHIKIPHNVSENTLEECLSIFSLCFIRRYASKYTVIVNIANAACAMLKNQAYVCIPQSQPSHLLATGNLPKNLPAPYKNRQN